MDRNIHVFFLFYGGEFDNTDYFPENGIFSPSKLFHYIIMVWSLFTEP